MKPVLWFVLVLAVIANASVSLTTFGFGERVLLGLGTGIIAIASIVGLILTSRKRR